MHTSKYGVSLAANQGHTLKQSRWVLDTRRSAHREQLPSSALFLLVRVTRLLRIFPPTAPPPPSPACASLFHGYASRFNPEKSASHVSPVLSVPKDLAVSSLVGKAGYRNERELSVFGREYCTTAVMNSPDYCFYCFRVSPKAVVAGDDKRIAV